MQPLFALAFLSWISIGKLNHILRFEGFPRIFSAVFNINTILNMFWY